MSPFASPYSDATPLAGRKARIGAGILLLSLSSFCNRQSPEGSRRWMGLLVLELLKDSPKNRTIVELSPEDRRRALGNMVIGEENELLRLIAGSIIRELMTNGSPEDIFWPMGTEVIAYTGFPKSQYHDSQWVEKFQLYLDDMHTQMNRTDQTSARFAQSLQFGEENYSFGGSQVILITVHGLLNIMIPADGLQTAKYVDIPLENITGTEVEETGRSSHSASKVTQSKAAIIIHLARDVSNTLYVNALGYSMPFIRLTLDTDTAMDLETRITRRQGSLPTSRVSVSQPVDVTYQDDQQPRYQLSNSEPLDVSYEGHKLHQDLEGVYTRTDRQTLDDLVATASRANKLISEERSEDVETSFQEGQTPSRKLLTSEENDANNGRVGTASPISLITMNGSKGNAGLDNLGEEIRSLSQHTNGLFANGLASSAQWLQGIYAIENAPEFQEGVTNGQVQGIDANPKEHPDNRSTNSPSGGSTYIAPEEQRSETSARSKLDVQAKLLHLNCSTIPTSAGKSKVSQRMRDREGEPARIGGTQESKPQNRKSLGKTKVSQPLSTVKTTKLKTSKAKAKKPARPKMKAEEVQQSTEANPVTNGEQDDVFAIPSSPTRASKTHLGLKPSKASSTRPTTTAASGGKKSRKLPKSSTLPAKGKKQRRPVDDDFDAAQELVDAEGVDSGNEHRTSELDDDYRPSSAKRANKSASVSGTTAVQPRVTKRPPTEPVSTVSKKATRETKSSAKKRQNAPAALIRPGTRRAAATRANLKIQGMSDHNTILPEVTAQKTVITNTTDDANPVSLSDQVDLVISRHDPGADQAEREDPSRERIIGHGLQIASEADRTLDTFNSIGPGNNEAKNRTAPIASMVCSGSVAIEPSIQNGDVNPSRLLVPSTPENLNISAAVTHPKSTHVQGAAVNRDAEFVTSAIEIQESTGVSVSNVDRGTKFNDDRGTKSNDDRGTKSNESRLGARYIMPVDSLIVDIPNVPLPRGEVSSMVGGENSHHFDNAMEFTDLDRIGENESSIPRETVPLLPLPFHNDGENVEKKPLTARLDDQRMSLINQDAAATDVSTEQQRILAELRPKHNMQEITNRTAGGDPFAARLNENLSTLVTLPQSVIPVALTENKSLSTKNNAADKTSVESVGSQPPNKLSNLGRSNSAPTILFPGHKKAKEGKEPDNRKAQIPIARLPERQSPNTLKAEEAITIDSETVDEIHRGRRMQCKVGSQNHEIIELSSGEDDSSKYASEVEVAQKASPPNEAEVSRPKRKSEEVMQGVSKKVKASVPKHIDVTTPVQEPVPKQTIDRNLALANSEEYLYRKPAIIAFSAKGPRNQGIISARKLQMKDLVQQEDLNEISLQQNLAPKRKHPKEETSGMDQTIRAPSGKRRRTINVASPMSEVPANTIVQGVSPSFMDGSQHYASQGTKIDPNGSPIPLAHPPRGISGGLDMRHMMDDLTEAEESNIYLQALADVEDTGLTLNEKIRKLGMDLPALEAQSSSSSVKREFLSSSIGKLLPSSPTAPSRMLQDMMAHREHADGKLVNLQTETVVHVADPQDPFVSKGQDQPNSFLQLLRASGTKVKGAPKKTAMKGMTVEKPRRPVGTATDEYEDDIDKTLVDEKPSLPSSPGSSSSESSNSIGKADPFKPSADAGSNNAVNRWREALRPHQKGTLDALYDVSNRLVQHLIAKEEAIDDVVKGYERDGKRLIDNLAQAHKDDYEGYLVHTRKVGEKLVSSFKDVQIGLNEARKEIKSNRIQDLAKMLRTEQQSLQSRLEEAILACT
ncbi:MAG: hypothetical protein Q9187_005717 [Circinaria calcarea]